MQVTTKITVDMTRQNVGQRVNAVQGDGNTRLVEITLLSGGAPWTPPEGVEAAIAYMQPGGTKGLYNKLADGTAAISISGNVATVILAPQMLVVSGTVQASVVFNDQQLNRLTTFPFSVSVASNPAAGVQKTEDYIRLKWLEDKLDEYLRKAADSGAFDGAPGADGHTPEYGVDYGTPKQISDIANKAAGILSDDIQKISDGKVDKVDGKGLSTHDYDNAAKKKVDEIPENPKYTDTVTIVDASLTKDGDAADAKVTGEKLNRLKDDLAAEQTAREQADTSLQQELSGKLPKSPVNWEQWTAEEQAAARARMGLPGEWELIEETTITEEIRIFSRSTEPNGKPYNFAAVVMRANFDNIPADIEYNSSVYTVQYNSRALYDYFTDCKIYRDRSLWSYVDCSGKCPNFNSFIAKNSGASIVTERIGFINTLANDLKCRAAVINTAKFEGLFPAGVKFTIWGVRA